MNFFLKFTIAHAYAVIMTELPYIFLNLSLTQLSGLLKWQLRTSCNLPIKSAIFLGPKLFLRFYFDEKLYSKEFVLGMSQNYPEKMKFIITNCSVSALPQLYSWSPKCFFEK